MPRPARLLPWLPPRAAACPAPSPRSRPNRRCIPCPSPPRAEGGTRAFAHARGKVPGVTRRRVGEPVTLKLVPTLPPPVTTGGLWQRRPKRSPTPAWATPAAGAHVRTHARAAHQSGYRRLPRQPGHVGPAREAAREQPAGCVSGRWRVLCAAREPAPPARRSPPARRRGGVWVSNAALPPWGFSGLSPSRREPPRAAAAAAPVAGQMQVAGDRGVFGPLEMSVRAPEEISNGGERVLGARRLEPPLAVGRRRGLTQAGWRARALHSLGAQPAAGQVPTRQWMVALGDHARPTALTSGRVF